MGGRFADFILFSYYFLISRNLVSMRPHYFIFIGYVKTGAGRGI